MAAQDASYRGRRDLIAKLVQLALDTAIAPARVLAGQTQDQLRAFGGQRRTTETATRATPKGSPLSADQLTVPAEDGFRADQEGCPGWSRQPAAERRKEQAISGLPAWTARLPLKDAKLMAEKQYLSLEAGLGTAAGKEEIEEQAEEAVEEGKEHDPASSQGRPLAQVSRRSEFPHPTPGLRLIDGTIEVASELGRGHPLRRPPLHRLALDPMHIDTRNRPRRQFHKTEEGD